MARSGNRTYIRDNRGRFASTGASTRTGSLGSLRARTSLKKSRAKLTSNSSPQQRGAVTRASRTLAKAKATNRQALSITRPKSTLSKIASKRQRPINTAAGSTAASTIRKTGRNLSTSSARNAIKPFDSRKIRRGLRLRQGAKAKNSQQKTFDNRVLRAGAVRRQAKETISNLNNKKRLSAKDKSTLARAQKTVSTTNRALRAYLQPKSKIVKYKTRGYDASISRIDRAIKSADKLLESIKKKAEPSKRRLARMNARTIASRLESGIGGKISRAELAITGTKDGLDVIRRRSERATNAAAKGSKPAARAREIYATQMAATGPGKPSKGANTIKPGPRSTKGQEPPKKSKKKRGRKPKK